MPAGLVIHHVSENALVIPLSGQAADVVMLRHPEQILMAKLVMVGCIELIERDGMSGILRFLSPEAYLYSSCNRADLPIRSNAA